MISHPAIVVVSWLNNMKPNMIILCLLMLCGTAVASGVYQTPEAFLEETFGASIPKPQSLWFDKDINAEVARILSHKPETLRTRYWRAGERSAWILEEIGKDKPITVGISVNQDRIERIRVLIFRESRGWEVRQGFFTDQFHNVGLRTDMSLDKPIDGITGATLSVNALIKLARVALYLHSKSELPRS